MYKLHEQYPENLVMYGDEGIIISAKHNFAFFGWELARLKGFVKKGATLVHVDSHLDDIHDGIYVSGIRDIKSIEEALCISTKLDHANFIWAGFATGVISNVIFACDENEEVNFNYKKTFPVEEVNKIDQILKGNDYKGQRYQCIEDLILPSDCQLILDLDLDYFVKQVQDDDGIFKEVVAQEGKIRQDLTKLKEMARWDFITVALEPYYCGGDDNCRFIFNIFKEVFDINESDLKKIPVLYSL